MPKKIIIKVEVRNEKCRSKAMKIAAVRPGVMSVSIEGEGRDQLVVTGDGVDSVELTNVLRKKLGHATIVSVQDEKPEEEKEEEVKPIEYVGSYSSYYPPPPPYYQRVVYDPYPSNGFIWY
ncbi:heavy metal-associated isoprenylated plant protein 47-like [Neltuma alba]|uniref:heavy metal-associated isoprenylated plant protein 47-like n=1 Tax=Neltuma alba TaxID=207710 RepID=UPI0010A2B1CF|nr:heavy metal-associated isoprenylated plant protein 47-like [Prosopis alba]XP_028805216.1 heavy metal-associated isoprenylated plant protein 47-like [Prosopis alba]